MWGVGCIFVEMVTGMPTFPGIRDTYDQLDKIFKLLGTPTEETWPGCTHFPGYKPHKLGKFCHELNKRIDLLSNIILLIGFYRFLSSSQIGSQFS